MQSARAGKVGGPIKTLGKSTETEKSREVGGKQSSMAPKGIIKKNSHGMSNEKLCDEI